MPHINIHTELIQDCSDAWARGLHIQEHRRRSLSWSMSLSVTFFEGMCDRNSFVTFCSYTHDLHQDEREIALWRGRLLRFELSRSPWIITPYSTYNLYSLCVCVGCPGSQFCIRNLIISEAWLCQVSFYSEWHLRLHYWYRVWRALSSNMIRTPDKP